MNGLIRWQQPDVAWPGFGRLSDLRNEIDRLFQAPLSEFARSAQLFSGWNPAIDMHEDNDNVYVHVELPGMKKDEIDLSLHDGAMSISGERRQESNHTEAEVYRSERFFGRFQRTILLPAPVAADKVKAQYKDGVLLVTLPKAEEAKPKQIDVHVN